MKSSYTALLAVCALAGGTFGAQAADLVTLNPVVITATRSAKMEIDVPMSIEIMQGESIRRAGATNIHTALAGITGIAYKSFGPGGGHMGTMSNEIAIRGIKNGTLVMINGNPINARGKYYLDAIPTERIDRVEVTKGGGSVLYGSEAMAGVINIITKDDAPNSLLLGYGNYGQRQADLNLNMDGFSLGLHREHWGLLQHVTEVDDFRYADLPGSRKDSLHLGYRFSDELSMSFDKFKSATDYEYYYFAKPTKPKNWPGKIGDLQQYRTYTSDQRLFQVNYQSDDFTAHAYHNRVFMQADGGNFFTRSHSPAKGKARFYNTKEENVNYGLDLQKTWRGDKTDWIAGITFQHEFYEASLYKDTDDRYSRDIWAAYLQAEHRLNDRDTIILSGRETKTRNSTADTNHSNFSAAGQWIHQLNSDENLYVNVSQSFIMPTFSQMFGKNGNAMPNPGLKPQKGINYEVGYKKMHNDHLYQFAVYHARINDNIKVDLDKDKDGILIGYQYINSEFKNTGAEISMQYQGEGPWSYRLGVSYNNPMVKDNGKTAKKPYWDRSYGRWQVNGTLTYAQGPWSSTLTAAYLADRVGSPSSSPSSPTKPYLLTTWNTTYHFNDENSLSLRIDNVLDREDNVSHSGTFYRSTPINYTLSYRYEF